MNNIEKQLKKSGWINTCVDKDIVCGSWPEKHVRVTMWNSKYPVYGNLPTTIGVIVGYEYASGDGKNVTEAFKNLNRNIQKGRKSCKFFPNEPAKYNNPVEQDYKKYLKSKKRKKS